MSVFARRRGPRASKKAQAKHAQTELTVVPDIPSVLAAIQTLYDEELKPFGRILRKRVAELAAGATSKAVSAVQLPNVDADCLLSVCEECELIRVEHEEGGDWSALLVNVRANLVNIYSPQDAYSREFWQEAQTYFESLVEGTVFPGGRYSCARMLINRKVPFLQGCSLGQLCHIVQLAVSQKKILGYRNGRLVPYSQSRSMMKEHCAAYQRPCSVAVRSVPDLPLASWEAACEGLRTILRASGGDRPGTLPLSNVKRIFRHQFKLDLSETALGYSKLCDLLQDERFQEICTVCLEENGYLVSEYNSSPKQQISLMQRLLPDQEPGQEDVLSDSSDNEASSDVVLACPSPVKGNVFWYLDGFAANSTDAGSNPSMSARSSNATSAGCGAISARSSNATSAGCGAASTDLERETPQDNQFYALDPLKFDDDVCTAHHLQVESPLHPDSPTCGMHFVSRTPSPDFFWNPANSACARRPLLQISELL